MNLEGPGTQTSVKRRMGASTLIAITTVIITATGCYCSLLFIDFEEPHPQLWPLYLPPVLVTVASLTATLGGRPLPSWISRAIFAGTLVFWIGVLLSILLLALWMLGHSR